VSVFTLSVFTAVDCCTKKQCWCFTSHGLNTVSQDEVVLVLDCLPDENYIPRDVFHLYKMLYQQAATGKTAADSRRLAIFVLLFLYLSFYVSVF